MLTPLPSTYLMNNIPRGTTSKDLLCSLADHWKVHTTSEAQYPLLIQMLEREPTIHDSQLDDSLSVAVLEFKLAHTPKWFQTLSRDPNGFPKVSVLGTLWHGVDLTSRDADGRTAFCAAVISGDVLHAETLAEFPQTDVNAQDDTGRTALHWACAARDLGMTEFLLTVPGLDSGLRDVDGFTAFDTSCEHVTPHDSADATADKTEEISTLFYRNMLELDRVDPDSALLRLLTVTSDPDEGAVFPGEALFCPVVANNLPLVKALMASGVDLSATNDDPETALHLAAKEGHVDMVEALLGNSSRGMTVNVGATTRDGLTALHYAADRGHRETVQELFRYGADCDAKDDNGATAFDRAVQKQHLAVQEILKPAQIEHEVIRAELDTPARAGIPDAGADRVSPLDHMFTAQEVGGEFVDPPLHRAVRNGQVDLVRRLLDSGADIEERNRYDSTALYTAVGLQNYDLVMLLLERGANVDARRCDGWTPLHIAASCGNPEIIKVLLDRGAALHVRDSFGKSALHIAAKGVHHQTLEVLLDRGADIDAVRFNGETALHHAARSGDRELVRLLLDRGANIQARTTVGRLPIDIAITQSNKAAIEILFEREGGSGLRSAGKRTKVRKIPTPYLITQF